MRWLRNNGRLISALFLAVGVSYPFLVYFGLVRFSAATVVWLVLAMAVLRFFHALHRKQRAQVVLTVVLLLVLALLGSVDTDSAVRIYPVVMNAGFAVIFGWSLIMPPTTIERLARLWEPELPEAAVRYTRKVTWVWLTFFLVNGGISAWTVWYGTLSQWTLYNGFLAYIGIGALFAGEFAVRTYVRRKEG